MLGSSGFEGCELSRPGGERSTGLALDGCCGSFAMGNLAGASSYLSSGPGVNAGVSPTLSCDDFLFFFSKYFLAKALSLALYSFSIRERSR